MNASASSSDVRYVISEIDAHLQYLQECQENIVVLNVGGSKFETSKTTLRADPSSIFALMLQPNSAFRPCNNIFSFDRDPAHFKIILNYLRNNCTFEKRYLPQEHHYLNEIAQEAKFYKLLSLKAIVEERLNDLCACKLNCWCVMNWNVDGLKIIDCWLDENDIHFDCYLLIFYF